MIAPASVPSARLSQAARSRQEKYDEQRTQLAESALATLGRLTPVLRPTPRPQLSSPDLRGAAP